MASTRERRSSETNVTMVFERIVWKFVMMGNGTGKDQKN